MPDGFTHQVKRLKFRGTSALLATLLAVIIFIIIDDPLLAWLFWCGDMLGYNFFGTYIDPDLDQHSRTSAEGRMIRDFGVIGILFAVYWSAYSWFIYLLAFVTKTLNGKLMGHQTVWSHEYVLSTAIRFVWAFWPFGIIIIEYISSNYRVLAIVLFAGIFAGLSKADAVHIYYDRKVKATWYKTKRIRLLD